MTNVLYLHGFASGPSSSKAQYFRERLQAADARVEIPDLAAGDFEHLTITSQLQAIERTAAARPLPLIGSSLGGYLAALYAARHPEVPRVVLLAPAFGFPHRWLAELGGVTAAEWRRTGKLRVFHYGENRERDLAYDLIEDGARYEDHPAIGQPALVIHGARDASVPVRYSEEFACGRPNVTLEIVNSDHQLLDVLEWMGERVEKFLFSDSGQ